MGKSSILVVLGFWVILAIASPNINNLATRSFDNYLSYSTVSLAHDIATSAANIGANALFLDSTWRTGYSNVPFSGGKYSVSAANYDTNKIKITAIGQYDTQKDTVIVVLQLTSFAKFAYYSNVEGAIYWATGDTVWGPFHTEAKMNISGTPVFYGKVSAKLGTNPKKSSAKFYGGFQSGVSITLPSDLSPVVNAANSGGKVVSSGDLWVTFAQDTVKWRRSAVGADTSTLLSAFAPNGVVLAAAGNIHVKGTLKGRATLCATGSAGLGKGNIYIDDDVKYASDPRTGPSTDMLGLVTDNNVIITDNTPNLTDVVVQASIFCRLGGFTAEHATTKPVSGTIDLLGGIVQYQRGPVGQISGSTIVNGYKKSYRYDDRFYVTNPPSFPNTGSYEIVSWLE